MIIKTIKHFQLFFNLAFLLIFLPQIIHTQPEFPNPDIQNQQTYEGDLILKNNDVMTIENTYYKIKGKIILQDSSRLIIRQSVIDLLGKAGEPRAISLQNSSLLQADTTIFGGIDVTEGIDPSQAEMLKSGDILTGHNSQLIMNNCFSIVQTFGGNSTVTIRNSYLVQEPLGLVHVEGNADVLFEDSFIGALFLPIPDNVPVVIDSLQPGYFEYWSAREEISEMLSYNLVLRRTEVMENNKGYQGGMELGWNIAVDILKDNMTISNSKLNKLILVFPDEEPAFISDLVMRQPIDFHLNNIHVLNTEIQTQWGVFMNGGPAEIVNSEGIFIFMTGGSSDILVSNSEVGEIDPRNYSGTLIYENSTWICGYEVFENSEIKIRGTVRMLNTVPIFDESSTITRTYDVFLLHDADSSPINNVNLTLSKDENTVWNGTTDASGMVSFEITFDNNNFQDEWILTSYTNQIHFKKRFSIYMSNPVYINLELGEDSVHYRPVLHVNAESSGFPIGTRERPYPTIQEAIVNSGGGTVYVHPGQYNGEISPVQTRGGITLQDSVVLIGSGADSTILSGKVEIENEYGAHISGFTIEDGIHALFSSLAIKNCIITGFGGTAISGAHADFQIINNVLTNNGLDAILLNDSCTAIIKNNIIINNSGFGINGVESASAIIDYNDVWGNTEMYTEFFTAGEHNISENPMFVNASSVNFHLQPGSPCIDSGDPDPMFNDLDGSRNNMGAFGGPYSPEQISGINNNDYILPDRARLFQNFPNPFNALTKICFDLPNPKWVNVTIYNIHGQKVRTLLDENKKAGSHTITWDGKDNHNNIVGNGIYIYRFLSGNTIYTKKALLLK